MSNYDWRTVFELIGLVSIIVSLIFFGLQIQQESNLARSALGAGSIEAINELELRSSDPEFAKVYAKMLREPDNLSDDEMIQINSYLNAAKSLFIRECYLAFRGVFASCRRFVRNNVPHFFGSTYAKSWWRANWHRTSNPAISEWINDEVEDVEPDFLIEELESIREGI